MKPYWTAAAVYRGQEQRAAYHVERQGFPFYLPQVLERNTSGTMRREYLFPGWLFIRISQHWRSLCSTRGIRKLLLTTTEAPARIPDREFEELRSREVAGFVQLPDPFQPGQSVKVKGAMNGCMGIVKNMPAKHRVALLVEFLGRKIDLEVDISMVEAA